MQNSNLNEKGILPSYSIFQTLV